MSRLFFSFHLGLALSLAACGFDLNVGDGPFATPPATTSPPASSSAPTPNATAPFFPYPSAPPPAGPGPNKPPPKWEWVQPSPSGNRLHAVHVAPGGDVWAVGEHGTVLRRHDGQWQQIHDAGPDRALNAVWASSDTDVWLSGIDASDNGVVIHFDGTTFQEGYGLAHARRPNALWGAAPNYVWAATYDGLIRWDGTSWLKETCPALPTIRCLYVTAIWGTPGSLEPWAVGENGVMLRRDAATHEWRPVNAYTPPPDVDPSKPSSRNNKYVGVWGSSDTDVWAVFENEPAGRVGISHFDGQSWAVTQLLEPAYSFLSVNVWNGHGRRVWGTSATNAVAFAGRGELTLRDGAWAYAPSRYGNADAPVGLGGDGSTGLLLATASDGILRWKPEALPASLPAAPPYRPETLNEGLAPYVERFALATKTGWRRAASDAKRVWLLGSEALPTQATASYGYRTVVASVEAGKVVGVEPIFVGDNALLPGETFYPSDIAADDGHLWVSGRMDGPSYTYRGVLVERANGKWVTHDAPRWALTLWAPGGDEVWAVSADTSSNGHGSLFRWQNGAWQELAHRPYVQFSGIHGLSTTDVWLAGPTYLTTTAELVVAHWDGSQLHEEFYPYPSVSPSHQHQIWVAGPNDVWVTGAPGRHLVGGTWQSVQPDGDREVVAVWGRGPNDVWLASSSDSYSGGYGYGNHWSGATFRHYDGAAFDRRGFKVSVVFDMAATSRGVWAVGGSSVMQIVDEEPPAGWVRPKPPR